MDRLDELRIRGEQLRRQVAGEQWVDDAARRSTGFGAGFEDLVTTFTWGGVWARDGLCLRDRSVVTTATLAALGKQEALAVHVAAALKNGVTRTELEEIFIQTGAYAGFPVTVAANRTAQDVLARDHGAA